jgi:hypothetical protein
MLKGNSLWAHVEGAGREDGGHKVMSEVGVTIKKLAKVLRIVVVNFWEIICKLA